MRRQAQARNPFLLIFLRRHGFRIRSLRSRSGMTAATSGTSFCRSRVSLRSRGLQTDLPICPAPSRKYFAVSFGRNSNRAIWSHTRQEGLRGRHERWVRDAMDARGAETNAARRGRRSRVVLASRRWRQVGGSFRR
jgi:hypothetical protein